MFERMLAKRNIGAQKRRCALTVCSIAIALALITMLFSMFSTAINILRGVAYSEGEYHIQIVSPYGLDKEQYDAVVEAVGDRGSCTAVPSKYSDRTRYDVNILLNEKISAANMFVDDVEFKAGVGRLSYFLNKILMLLDMKDVQSELYMASIVALFYVFVLFLIMMLRLIIDTVFEISSKERERQFGVLQSVGATPKQIIRVITYEGLMLSVIGIPLGVGAGIGLGYIVYRAVLGTKLVDLCISPEKAAELVHFSVSPWLLLLGVITGVVWVFLSAYGTGMRVIKMSPVQAISQRSGTVDKVKQRSLFGKLFGWTGKLAARNNRRQPKRFTGIVVSLAVSVVLLSMGMVVIDGILGFVEKNIEQYRDYTDFIVFHETDDYHFYREPMELLEKSGLFDKIYFITELNSVSRRGKEETSDINVGIVTFYSRDSYERAFDGAPPVSYDELAKSGKFILNAPADSGKLPDRVSVEIFDGKKEISEEEYNALSDEDKEYVNIYGTPEARRYEDVIRYTREFEVFTVLEDSDRRGYSLTGTLEQYDKGLYTAGGMSRCRAVSCTLADYSDYFKARDLMEKNFTGSDEYSYYDEGVAGRRARAEWAAVKIGSIFLGILIALIAVVNMVNILSTGILNRRGELAAMRCVGMTDKQLNKMIVLECLQYALTSGIAAVAVCELMMFLTHMVIRFSKEIFETLHFLNVVELSINYALPLPIIGIASLCAFGVAAAASVIPLGAMRKTSLVDRIRTVE